MYIKFYSERRLDIFNQFKLILNLISSLIYNL